MNKHLNKLFYQPLHPFLAAVYPTFYLYTRNACQTKVESVAILIVFCLIASTAAYKIFSRLCSDRLRGGILATLSMAAFFSYGHVFNFINLYVLPIPAGRHRFLLPGYTVLFFLAGLWVYIKIKSSALPEITRFLNIVLIPLFALCALQMPHAYALSVDDISCKNWFEEKGDAELLAKNPPNKPDIYYIILDGYARADVLKEIYGYDNSAFINELKRLGFFVPLSSRSNYHVTMFSLASSLNMNYLDAPLNQVPQDFQDTHPMQEIINRNKVARLLRKMGYQYIHLSSGWSMTRKNRQADIVMRNFADGSKYKPYRISSFNAAFFRTTLARPFMRSKVSRTEYRRVIRSLGMLRRVKNNDLPQFVFSHIVAPHPPFVVDKNGRQTGVVIYSNTWKPRSGYLEQLAYVNQQILLDIKTILKKSKSPPIIILQADHGPASTIGDWNYPGSTGLKERMSIFCAIHLPKHKAQELKLDSLTPVNLFRIIFDSTFGTHYGMLPLKQYFGNKTMPFKLHMVVSEK